MTSKDIKKLWGDELYDVFAEHINEDGWLTEDWVDIIESEIPRFDSDWNDNPVYKDTYQRMYMLDMVSNEDETMCKPFPYED